MIRNRATLVRAVLALCTALLPITSADAQQVRQAPPSLLAQFDVQRGTLQTISLPATQQDAVVASVSIAGARYTMDLRLHDVRAPNFQLLERTSAGLQPLPRPDCVTYRGGLLEVPNARVAATVQGGTVEAMIHLPATAPGQLDEVWVVQLTQYHDHVAGHTATRRHFAHVSKDELRAADGTAGHRNLLQSDNR